MASPEQGRKLRIKERPRENCHFHLSLSINEISVSIHFLVTSSSGRQLQSRDQQVSGPNATSYYCLFYKNNFYNDRAQLGPTHLFNYYYDSSSSQVQDVIVARS